jgi:hypothetical protein
MLFRLFKPKHTVFSVAERLEKGFREGSIILEKRQSDLNEKQRLLLLKHVLRFLTQF